MQYQTFSDAATTVFPYAILLAELDREQIDRAYIASSALKPEEVIAYSLHHEGKKTKVGIQREYLDDLLPVLQDLQTQYLIVGDAEYFKTLTGAKKADSMVGYVVPNTYPESLAGAFQVVYCPSYRQIFYDPERTTAKISSALTALESHVKGHYSKPGADIIKFCAYPRRPAEIERWLDKLLAMDCQLSCDTETFSLKHYESGLGTIGFAWNKHEGIAFPVDLGSSPKTVRKLLTRFFRKLVQKSWYHNASFDIMILIRQLFMKDMLDYEGLLDGLSVLTRNFEDTKIITYLATNSCAGNKLGLKDQAQEFAGDYAQEDIKDITKIPLDDLLEYNLVDCLSTWHVAEKHWDTMVADEQLEIYQELFKPSLIDIIQMQLTGMPLDMTKVHEARDYIENEHATMIALMQGNIKVQEYVRFRKDRAETQRYQDWLERKNNGVKVRAYVPGNFDDLDFNPGSSNQKVELLFEMCGLPILSTTDTGQGSTGKDDLEDLQSHTTDPDLKDLLKTLVEFSKIDKILTSFLPHLLAAPQGPDGWHYLFGNFNLGGTLSGRLSSSGPNLQNLPAKGKLAKIIKDCFRAPPGWLKIGLDFASLEDRISALTTKDPNKLKVYTDGFDGHCLRAYSYFGDQMSNNLNPNDPESINSIADLYPDLRQDSKTPTFALTYQGTFRTLMAKCGFIEIVARQIEERYHELYKVSDEWVDAQLKEASKTGFVVGAFGLRVRTPLLKQVIRGNRATPAAAAAEGRSAGNALGQSWCLLNSRASVEFLRKVRKSKYRLLIRPIAHIHDAQYFIIPDDLEVLMFVNEHLVKAVQWQDHPAIWHDQVKLGGELSIFWPSWAHECEIPNHANENRILECIDKHVTKLEKAA